MSLVGFIGDSLTATAPSRANVAWSHEIETDDGHVCGNAADGGSSISAISSQYTSSIKNKGYDACVIMGGINDIRSDATAAAIWVTYEALIDEVIADGLDCIVCTTLPFGNDAAWTAGRQAELDSLNAFIRGKAGIILAETHDAIEDPGTDNIDAAYDSGDGLHINQAGNTVIADLVGPLIP